MKKTADRYYDDTNLMDIRVLSTLGLTEDDISDMAALDEIEVAQGGYSMDVLLQTGETETVVKVIGNSTLLNQLMITEGRQIQKKNECVLDDRFMKNRHYSIGDTLTIHSGTDTPLEDSMTENTFTIVGSGTLPYYMDLTRGVGSIGDGSLSGFMVVAPEVFDMDVYTEAYLSVVGVKGLNSYSDEYKDRVAAVVDKLEELSDPCEQRRYDSIRTEAEDKIADGKAEVEDAKKELADAKDELDDGEEKLKDGRKELDDAKTELENGEKELTDAKTELENGEKELADAKAELDSGEKELTDAQTELSAAESQLRSGRAELDSGKQQLEAAEAELNSGEEQAAAGREELDQAKAELEAAKQQLDDSEAVLQESATELENGKAELERNQEELESGRAELETQEGLLKQKEEQIQTAWKIYEAGVQTFEYLKTVLPPESQLLIQMEAALAATYEQLTAADAQISDGKAQIEEAKQVLADGEAQLQAGWAEYEAGLAAYNQGLEEWNAGKASYEEAFAQYEKGEEEWAAGKAVLDEGRAAYEASKATYLQGEAEWEAGNQAYQSGLQQYEEGKATWESGRQQYLEGKETWEDGKKQYEEGKQTLDDGKKEYEDGLKTYNKNLKKWKDGKQEYEDAEAEALPKIADAEQEIADAEEKLGDLEVPEWYVLDRDKIQSCVSYGSDAERMDSLGNVFPVLFFLVAALVSLTAMTRMVEEQRQQMGILKAMGYGGGTIAWKYFGYAMLATVIGGIIGVVIGEKALPWVIMSAYGMLYTGLPYLDLPLNLTQGGLAVILSVLCTGGATLAACARKLIDSPAKLMRPEAPKGGSRILLERIPFLWKRFNFTRKATLRNLFRYKKRFFMTIIGIGGCMGLMLVGFGIRDSITVVAQNQFVEIFMQDETVSMDTSAKEEDRTALISAIDNYEGVAEWMPVSLTSVTLNANGKDRTASLYVPEDVDHVKDYVRFRNRITKETYPYPTSGVALSEKTASMLDVKVGDTLRLQKSEGEPYIELTVETIVENYVQHYAFISPEVYEKVFHEPVDYNLVYVKSNDFSEAEEEAFGKMLLKMDACTGFSTTRAMEKQITDMLQTLNNVIWVLILAAALLAFVVLYNLNSINMTERKRELATLKVLGFYDPEVAMYVYRENILLTLIGIAAGCVIGKVLHLFTILTVEVDLMMFGRVIGWKSYLLCAVLTGAFSVAVNLIMYAHFKGIDMIASLKSVE